MSITHNCTNCLHQGTGEFDYPCVDCKSYRTTDIPSKWETNAFKPTVNEAVTGIEAVNHPSHYNQGGIECIDAMVAAFGKEAVANFCVCNAFKYLFRHEHKGGMQDIDKAIWYLNKYKGLNSSE